MGTVPPTPHFDPGEFPTAAKMNQIQTALNYLMNPPRVLAYASAAQNNTTTGAFQTIALDQETIDTDTMHDLVVSNSRLTCQTPGKFEVSGQATFAANATGRRLARIAVNGVGGNNGQTEVTTNTVAGASTAVAIPTMEISLLAGDYLELQGFQNTGANLGYMVGLMTFFRAKWIGA